MPHKSLLPAMAKYRLAVPLLLALLVLAGALTSQQTDRSVPRHHDSQAEEVEDECGSALLARWSEDNLAEVSDLWGLDSTDQSKLREIGQRLSDVNHWKNDPFEVVRFLFQFDMDVDYAEKMFREMVAWRLANDVDTFMERYKEPPELFHSSPFAVMKGLDKDGDPIFVQSFGSFDALGFYHQAGPQALRDGNLFLTELISDRNLESQQLRWQKEYYEPLTGHRFKHFTNVVDLKGLSASQVRPALLRLLKESAQIGQAYYPGFAKRVIIIRAPKVFRWAWSIVQHFYDDNVKRKFVFVTHNDFLSVLSDYMDLEHLPPVIDPVKCKGQLMPGYFEKIQLEGGKVQLA